MRGLNKRSLWLRCESRLDEDWPWTSIEAQSQALTDDRDLKSFTQGNGCVRGQLDRHRDTPCSDVRWVARCERQSWLNQSQRGKTRAKSISPRAAFRRQVPIDCRLVLERHVLRSRLADEDGHGVDRFVKEQRVETITFDQDIEGLFHEHRRTGARVKLRNRCSQHVGLGCVDQAWIRVRKRELASRGVEHRDACVHKGAV